jgi:hypothetical protein
MSNPAQRAIAIAQRTVARHSGLAVRYTSGVASVIGLRAVPAAVSAEVLIEEDLATRALAQDFLTSTAAILYDGVANKPKVGDQITVAVAGGQRIYEVVRMGKSHFEPGDPYGLQWRIHTLMIQGDA